MLKFSLKMVFVAVTAFGIGMYVGMQAGYQRGFAAGRLPPLLWGPVAKCESTP
jgi:hypothetical protein